MVFQPKTLSFRACFSNRISRILVKRIYKFYKSCPPGGIPKSLFSSIGAFKMPRMLELFLTFYVAGIQDSSKKKKKMFHLETPRDGLHINVFEFLTSQSAVMNSAKERDSCSITSWWFFNEQLWALGFLKCMMQDMWKSATNFLLIS